MKKLKIKFVKFENALAVQVLEQEGLTFQKDLGNVRIMCSPSIHGEVFFLRGDFKEDDFKISSKLFENNKKRDDFILKTIKNITTELFTQKTILEKGTVVEVSDLSDFNCSHKHVLIATLPEDVDFRYIVRVEGSWKGWKYYKYARPLSREFTPKIERNGDIILATWEEA